MISSPFYCDNCGAANRPQASFCYACGQPLHASSGKSTTTSTGLLSTNLLLKQRYRILGQIGKGGFGAVYRAMDIQFGNRLVAIKEMSQSNLSSQELVEATASFKREALLLAGLTHPNLPRIYEQFMDMGRWYLVMDFIEGETLEDFLEKQPGKKLSVEKTLEIGLQICNVLEYLHNRQPPIIFRDLKPANIMLTASGHIYLIDFGIARHFKPGQAKDTAALGSTGYAAPEQYGKSQTTQRADIYALGATLHQLLSGDDPSESPFRFAPLKLSGQPQQPALVRLQQLIMQMVDMDLNKRPASVSIIKQELQHISTQLLVSNTHPLPQGTLPTGIASIPPSYQPPTMPKLQRTSRSNKPQIQRQSNTRAVCSGHTSRVTAIAWSPKAAQLASASYDKTVRIWDATTGNNILQYRGHWDRVLALAWSPDSTRIASAGNDGTIQVWDATTGNALYTYRGHNLPVNTLAWSPDSLRIASGGEDKIIQVWEAANGTILYSYQGHTDSVYTLAWSPDGKRIASGADDKTVQVWSPFKAKSGFFTLLLNPSRSQFTYKGHTGRVHAVAWSPNGLRLASVSSDKTLQVWDSLTGKKYFIHRSSTSGLNAVAWSPDNRYVLSGGNDKMVQVWDIMTRHTAHTYRGHSGYITSLAWSPDGKLVASGSVDHTVQIWEPK